MDTPLSVNDLTIIINEKFEKNISNQYFTVEGEVQNFSDRKHCYFSLKDNDKGTIINCILWENIKDKNNYDITEGDIVTIRGKIKIYHKMNKYSLQVSNLIINKNKQTEYEKKYNYYKKLGYFKKKLSFNKENFKKVGLITSSKGEAINDFIKTLKNKFFIGNIYKYNVNVQGINCAKDIIKAINYFENKSDVDVILITRGGGSKIDLDEFNNKELIERIYKRKKVIFCAIGHERDNSLCDYVCDLRSSTPTSLALEISEDYKKLELKLRNIFEKQKIYYEEFKNLKVRELNNHRNNLYLSLIKNKSDGLYLQNIHINKLEEFKKYSNKSFQIKLEDCIIEFKIDNYKLLNKFNKKYLYSNYEKEYNYPTYNKKINNNLEFYLDEYKKYNFGTKEHYNIFSIINKLTLKIINDIEKINNINKIDKDFSIINIKNLKELYNYKNHLNYLNNCINNNFNNIKIQKINKIDNFEILERFNNYKLSYITEEFIMLYKNLLEMDPRYFRIKR